MSVKELCKRIPDEVRSQRLLVEGNPIFSAVTSKSDPNMALLTRIWQEFVEPERHLDTGCPICLSNIKQNFIYMYDELVKLEEEYQKLQML